MVVVPSLRIDTLGTLDLDTTCTPINQHNFNIIQPGLPGNGTLKLSSKYATATFPKGSFANFFLATGGRVWYYGKGWSYTLPITTAGALPIATYRNLVLDPATDTITFGNKDITVYNDLTIQPSSGKVIMSTTSLGKVTINHDLTVGSGTKLRFQSTGTARSLVVSNNLNNFGAVSLQTGGTLAHAVSIGGSLYNNGSVDFQPGLATETRAVLTMTGSTNGTISGVGTFTRLNQLVVNKGTSNAATLDVTVSPFSLGGTPTGLTAAKPLYLLNGTFKLSTSQNLVVSSGANTSSTQMFTVPGTAALWVAAGKVILSGTGAYAGMQLDGGLKLTSTGVVRLDCGVATTSDNSIQYGSSGYPSIDMGGDSLVVGGQIRGNAVAGSGTLVYSQSRGNVYLGFRNTYAAKPMFEITTSGANTGNFIMTGGQIQLAKSKASATIADITLQPTTYTVTGGSIVLGMGAYTANATQFSIKASAPIYNLTLNTGSTASNPAKVILYTSPLQVLGTATFNTNATFTANNIDLKLGGNWVNNGTYIPGTNSTWFNGTTNQSVSGTTAPAFNDVIVSNTAPSGKGYTCRPGLDHHRRHHPHRRHPRRQHPQRNGGRPGYQLGRAYQQHRLHDPERVYHPEYNWVRVGKLRVSAYQQRQQRSGTLRLHRQRNARPRQRHPRHQL